MLIGTIMQIAREAKLLFRDNNAFLYTRIWMRIYYFF